MSTILKALRRLEEEKSRGATSRPLREEVASGPSAPPRRRLPWLPVLAMLLGAGLGASAWWVWPYERGGKPVRELAEATPADSQASAPSPAAATQIEETHVTRRVPPGFNDAAAQIENQLHGFAGGAPGEAVDPVTAPPDDLAAGGPPEDAFASNVEVVERPTPEPRIAPVAPGSPPQRVIQDPAHLANEPPAVTARRARRAANAAKQDAPAQTIAATQTQPRTSTPDPVTAPAAPHPTEQVTPKPQATGSAPVPRTTSPTAAARASEPPAPAPTPEPRATKPAPERVAKKSAPAAVSPSRDDGSVRVKRTQWHPEPARRSADLDVDGQSASVHEGDLVGEYVVTEIRPSGVVLTRDGQRVERGIGQAP